MLLESEDRSGSSPSKTGIPVPVITLVKPPQNIPNSYSPSLIPHAIHSPSLQGMVK
jgi:hypothetical protein